MPIQQTLRSLVREAELYRIQGLLAQSRNKYLKVLKLASKSKPSDKRQTVIDAVNDKIQIVDRELAEIHEGSDTPELSDKVQGLIKRLFGFSKTEESAALEGAVALAKFGQYEKALAEFNPLLEHRSLALIVAKNILRCHISLASPEAAIDQYTEWVDGNCALNRNDLKQIREFLSDLFERMGLDIVLPEVQDNALDFETMQDDDSCSSGHEQLRDIEGADGVEIPMFSFSENEGETEDSYIDCSSLGKDDLSTNPENAPDSGSVNDLEDVLDISSLKVLFHKEPLKGKSLTLEVTFQVGNVVSVLLPQKKKALLRYFTPKTLLPEIKVCSPMTEFNAKGKVLGRTEVESGLNRGNFMLDILVYSD